MRHTTADRLLLALSKQEDRLVTWLNSSEDNLRWFRSDPMAAIEAAHLEMSDELMAELRSTVKSINNKLCKEDEPD